MPPCPSFKEITHVPHELEGERREGYNVICCAVNLSNVVEGEGGGAVRPGCVMVGVPGVTSWILLAKRDNPCRARQSHIPRTEILRKVPTYAGLARYLPT